MTAIRKRTFELNEHELTSCHDQAAMCADGHEGPLCAICKEGHYKVGENCAMCEALDDGTIACLGIAGIVLCLIAPAYTTSQRWVWAQELESRWRKFWVDVSLGQKLKTMVVFYQVVVSMAWVFGFDEVYPESYKIKNMTKFPKYIIIRELEE